MITVQAAGFSDIGKVRKTNEDSYLLNDLIGLYIVADGMGGHRGGEVASRIAVDTIAAFMSKNAENNLESSTAGAMSPTNDVAHQLRQSISLANQQIYSHSLTDPTCRGMGTTVSALCLSSDAIITANVGDSPIYLLRNGDIENLYTPHTLLHEHRRIPKSLEGRFSNGKLAHILTRAVGIRSEVAVDVVETPCFENDIIILCSDGLSGKLSREEIRDMCYQNTPQAACNKMSDLALQRGGEDNVTVVVVRLAGAAGASSRSLIRKLTALPAWIASRFTFRRRT